MEAEGLVKAVKILGSESIMDCIFIAQWRPVKEKFKGFLISGPGRLCQKNDLPPKKKGLGVRAEEGGQGGGQPLAEAGLCFLSPPSPWPKATPLPGPFSIPW